MISTVRWLIPISGDIFAWMPCDNHFHDLVLPRGKAGNMARGILLPGGMFYHINRLLDRTGHTGD